MISVKAKILPFLFIILIFMQYTEAFSQTSSPFNPPKEKLGVYVVNSGSGLDTGCTFRGSGPLIIRITVPAVVNHDEINSDGKLKDPSKLVNAGLLSDKVIIRFPVYDIDSASGEVDYVYFNGKYVKTLNGINNRWTDDSLVIPISDLKFKSANSPNAVNEMRIDIDQANIGYGEYWCMAVDWVAVTFDAAYPYVLAHGIAATSSTWDEDDSPGVLTELKAKGVLFNRFSVAKNGLCVDNAKELKTKIKDFLDTIKADKVHVIAHSKGGLDTQALASMNPPFKILSLSTLSTPHLGSVTADLTVIQREKADEKINSGADPNGYAKKFIDSAAIAGALGQGPGLPGIRDLTTYRATSALSSRLTGNIKPTFTYGADADVDGDGQLDDSESDPLFGSLIKWAGRLTWQVMRDFSEAKIVSVTTKEGWFWTERKVLTYNTVTSQSPQDNDIVVTTRSAHPSYGTSRGTIKGNHSTVKNPANIRTILSDTIKMR